jgi:2-phosphosulfolactate phosphatase
MAFRPCGAYGAGVIDVALTPADLRPAEIAVVIDVLRATSTATQALGADYRRVMCTETLTLALGLRAPGRVLAGERNGIKPPGFDQGNSPAETTDRRGDELVLATTNGAPAIVAAAGRAPRVILACLLNLDAVVRTLRSHEEADVQIVCSGTDGAAALEDVYVAGRLCAALAGERTDAALVAAAVARAFPTAFDALAASRDAARLRAVDLGADITACAVESVLDIVPGVIASRGGVATVCVGESRDGDSGAQLSDTVGV